MRPRWTDVPARYAQHDRTKLCMFPSYSVYAVEGLCPRHINLFGLACAAVWTDIIPLLSEGLSSDSVLPSSSLQPHPLHCVPPPWPFLTSVPPSVSMSLLPSFPQTASVCPSPKQTRSTSQSCVALTMSASYSYHLSVITPPTSPPPRR